MKILKWVKDNQIRILIALICIIMLLVMALFHWECLTTGNNCPPVSNMTGL